MIISKRIDEKPEKFESLLKKAHCIITDWAEKDQSYFLHRSAIQLEKDVYDILCEASKNTSFEDSIELISGHKFPDIVIEEYFGVEVKTTRQDSWKSVGNSVLESTRIQNVEKIYLFFAKLLEPVSFQYRLYQDCLYDIAVTHSPRYLIDMNLKDEESIFRKIGLSYDELRTQENPIKSVVSYYRSIAVPGEEPWWMDSSDYAETAVKATVTLWRNLSSEDKNILRSEAIARFPEIVSNSNKKYQGLATWLAARHGIVDASLRDRFSAGGKVDLEIGETTYKQLPRVFLHLKENAYAIIESVQKLSPEEAQYYWKLSAQPSSRQEQLSAWIDLLMRYSKQSVKDCEKFIVHLLGINLSDDECPEFIKERQNFYAVNK